MNDLLPSYIDKRLVGELVYQLEQRIFHFIFNIEPLSRRCIENGYEPINIKETIVSLSMSNNNQITNGNECRYSFIYIPI